MAGELFRGANGLSPDLGDLIVSPNGASGTGPARGASPGSRRPPRSCPPPPNCARGTPQEKLLRGTRGMEHAVSLALAGDARIARIFEEAGRALGIADRKPDHAVRAAEGHSRRIGPPGGRSPPRAVARCGRKPQRPKTIAGVTEIVVHESGDDTWARGAAALTLRDLYGAPWEHDRTSQEALTAM